MRTQPGRLLPAADGDQRGRHGRENGTVHVVDVIPVRIAFIPPPTWPTRWCRRIARTDAVPAAAGERRRRAGICMVRERRLAGGRNPTHVRLHAGERGRIRSHLPGDGHGRKPGRTLAPHHARIVESESPKKTLRVTCYERESGARHHDDRTARVEPGARIPARARTVRQRKRAWPDTPARRASREARLYAENRLKKGEFVSLGNFGGYVILAFDHSVGEQGADTTFRSPATSSKGATNRASCVGDAGCQRQRQARRRMVRTPGQRNGRRMDRQEYAVTYYEPAGPRQG